MNSELRILRELSCCALPRGWRRFGCPSLNSAARLISIFVSCLLLTQLVVAQNEPTPATPPAEAPPPAEEQPAATPAPPETKPAVPQAEQPVVDDTNSPIVIRKPKAAEKQDWRGERNGVAWRPPMVVIGRDAEVKADEAVEALVVIGGSGIVHGRVREAAVAIGGDLEIDGQVGQEAVAILGNITAHKGARVRGEAVAVGGRVKVAEGARVRPQGVELPDLTWLRKWFVQCALLMRPLSLKVTWVWLVAGIFLGFYLIIAALFPRPVRACVDELTTRPATTFSMGLLTLLLFPLAILILGVTGIGLLVVPFVLAAVFFGALIGRVAVLEWVGWRLGHQFGAPSFNNPISGLLLGALVIAVLYLVPFLGLLTFAIVSLWSLGVAVTAAFGGLRREMPEKPKPAPATAGAPAMTMAASSEAAAMPENPGMSSAAGLASQPQPQVQFVGSLAPTAPPVVPEILTYPKASFWERIGAAFLDVILVSILCAVLHPIAPLVALAYFSALWAWKGTTIGGIVVGLKVVRVDGKPLTFPVSLIRSLAAAFSILVLFLGYLWIAWDPEKQGWHDKIAGTVVLKLPKGIPLV
jgi:uncharacterized RDD family membrane protein YckC